MQTTHTPLGKRILGAAVSAAMTLSMVPASIFTADAAIFIDFKEMPPDNCYTDHYPTIYWEATGTQTSVNAVIYRVDENGSDPVMIKNKGPVESETMEWTIDSYDLLDNYYQVWFVDQITSARVKSDTFYVGKKPEVSEQEDYVLGSAAKPRYSFNFPAYRIELIDNTNNLLNTYVNYGSADHEIALNTSRSGPEYDIDDFGADPKNRTYKFRTYYTKSKYIDTNYFSVVDPAVSVQPKDVYVYNGSPNGVSAWANFGIQDVRLVTENKSSGENYTTSLDSSRYVLNDEGDAVKVKFAAADASPDTTYRLELKYGDSDTDWVRTDEFHCYADEFKFTTQPEDVTIKPGKTGIVEHRTGCSDPSVYAVYEELLEDGEIIKANSDGLLTNMDVDDSYAGHEYQFKTYYPAWTYDFDTIGTGNDYILSNKFHVLIGADVNFLAQPVDVELTDDGKGLATCAVDFDPVAAYLCKDGEIISDKCTWETEDGSAIINCSVDDSLIGSDIKFKVYYDTNDSYIESDTFSIGRYCFTEQPRPTIVLGRQTGKASAIFKTSFEPAIVDVELDGKILEDIDIFITLKDGGSVIDLKVDDSYVGKTMRVYAYATSDRDGKYACSNIINVIPPLYPRIDMMTPGAVIPEGEDEVQVAFETNFGFTDYELIADGETAAEYHNDRILYEDVVPVSKDMVGKQLMIRVTCLKNEEMGIDEETVVESQLFEAVLPDSEHKFTSQPHDMDISAGIPDDQTWSTNFTPVRLCVMSGPWAICEFEDPGDLIGIGPTEWFKTVFNGESRLRAYYGEGPLDYVESCIINTVCPEFTIDPTGGYIHEGETLNVEWETNFTPKKVELWTDSEFCKELEPDAASIELDGKGVGYYNILAYYSDDVASGVFSSGFAVKLTDQQIYTITVPDDVRISYGAGYLTRNALAGENVDIFRTSSEPVFSKWVCKSGNAEFDDEYSEYTYFTMPSGDVVIDYETAEDEQPTSDEDYPKGDVNGDGEVNVTDVVLVAAHVKSIRALFDDRLARADVNHDDDVNVTDLTKIAAHVKGIKTLE